MWCLASSQETPVGAFGGAGAGVGIGAGVGGAGGAQVMPPRARTNNAVTTKSNLFIATSPYAYDYGKSILVLLLLYSSIMPLSIYSEGSPQMFSDEFAGNEIDRKPFCSAKFPLKALAKLRVGCPHRVLLGSLTSASFLAL